MRVLNLNYFLFLGLLCSVVACNKKTSPEKQAGPQADAHADPHVKEESQIQSHNYVFEVKESFGASQETFLPTILWDLLEEKKVINSRGKIENFTGEAKGFEENVFVGLTLRLKEKTPGVLGGKNLEFQSKKATGLFIDLAQYIKGNKGTFILSFEPSSTLDPVTAQVLFLSDSEKRKEKSQEEHGQVLGAGCHRFFDITKSYLKKIKDQGIEVNISGGRHVSLLAGTFFLRVAHEMGVRAFTHLTITDSNYPELLCDKIISKE